ncbi:hypothetical protein [Methanobrevibacter sp.]|uniref:hypothetical protein n=1 Tax=Methanobrevibacter sp. TaxID=66852 RepID=UPI0038669DE5
MDITKYPQYELYLLTLNLENLKSRIVPDNCDERCINSTIISRAYFSSYLYCALWLEYVKNFIPIPITQFGDDEAKISEHVQVRNALFNFGQQRIEEKLYKLANLRKTADYDPFRDLAPTDVSDAIGYMESIFDHLKFD